MRARKKAAKGRAKRSSMKKIKKAPLKASVTGGTDSSNWPLSGQDRKLLSLYRVQSIVKSAARSIGQLITAMDMKEAVQKNELHADPVQTEKTWLDAKIKGRKIRAVLEAIKLI